MTRNAVRELFLGNEGKNFVIITDIAQGHGINGVSYKSFEGLRHWEDRDYSHATRYRKTEILDFGSDYLLIRHEAYDEAYTSGTFVYAIDYAHITAIMFVEKVTWCGNLAESL